MAVFYSLKRFYRAIERLIWLSFKLTIDVRTFACACRTVRQLPITRLLLHVSRPMAFLSTTTTRTAPIAHPSPTILSPPIATSNDTPSMPATCSTIPITRSSHARHSPPPASHKRANTGASEKSPKRPKPNIDDHEAELNKTKGGRDGKEGGEKDKKKGRKGKKPR